MSNFPPFSPRRQSPLPVVIAGAAFMLATWLVLDRAGVFTPTPKAEPRAVTPRGDLAPLEQSFVDVFDRCSPSVASINTSSIIRTWGGLQEQQGAGSGFVWDNSGTVVTNNHVVEGASEVQVTVAGRNFHANVIATSPNHDLAVLRLVGNVSGLVPLPVGKSADLKVGQTAIAIGNPFGFDQTMTTGIVSAINRTIQAENGNLLRGLIQVDAAINRGNSGGPLLDSAGRLIGVTTAIYSPSGTSAGIGFAVPVDTVNEIVPRLIGGKSTAAVLGVRASDSNYVSYRLDPGLGFTSGAIVGEILDGYGAAAAGLRPFRIKQNADIEKYGDVIVAIDDRPVRTFEELPRVLAKCKPGEKVGVKVIRGLPDKPQLVQLDVELKFDDQGLRSTTQ